MGIPFINALSNPPRHLNREWSLPPVKQGDWSETLRSFDVEEGEEAKSVAVLMYHRILADEDIETWHYDENGQLYDTIVHRQAFEEQIDYLAEQGYVTLNLKEFEQFINGALDVPEKSVLITFDDGFKDNYTVAYPILKRHDFFATIFLITGKVVSEDALYLSEEDIIAGADVFEYQSHTDRLHERTEADIPYLLTHDHREVESDVLISVNKLGGRKRAFAYPYGEYDQANLTVLNNVGVDLAFTVEYKKADQEVNRLEIPRIGVYPDDTIEEFILKLK